LGFTFMCGKSRRGAFQLQRKTRRDRADAMFQEAEQPVVVDAAKEVPDVGVDAGGGSAFERIERRPERVDVDGVTSRSPASCSTLLHQRPSPSMPRRMRLRPLRRARAAARPCKSSRCSRPVNAATGRPRRQPPSGSIRRELAKHPPPSNYRAVSPVQGRPRPSSSQPLSGQAREVQIGVKLPLPSVPSHLANTAPPHDHSASHTGAAPTSAGTAPKSP
jgi:hypothetical protein